MINTNNPMPVFVSPAKYTVMDTTQFFGPKDPATKNYVHLIQ